MGDKLFNYYMSFDNRKEGKHQKIIYVLIQATGYFEANQEAKKYKDCLEPHYVYWGTSYTDNTLDNPPYLDECERFISLEELKQMPEYVSKGN